MATKRQPAWCPARTVAAGFNPRPGRESRRGLPRGRESGWLSYKVRIMYELADGVWQLPLVPHDAINAYLICDVLVDLDRGPV